MGFQKIILRDQSGPLNRQNRFSVLASPGGPRQNRRGRAGNGADIGAACSTRRFGLVGDIRRDEHEGQLGPCSKVNLPSTPQPTQPTPHPYALCIGCAWGVHASKCPATAPSGDFRRPGAIPLQTRRAGRICISTAVRRGPNPRLHRKGSTGRGPVFLCLKSERS